LAVSQEAFYVWNGVDYLGFDHPVYPLPSMVM
jgi:hypothetical protein